MTDFVKKLRAKGYTARELAARWSLLPRQISRIGKAPKQIHLDALAGLPDKVVEKCGCCICETTIIFPTCVIDVDKIKYCSHAMVGMEKEDCEYWRVVK
jgi:hypothetical protein